MALSDTARRILAKAAQYSLRLAAPPKHLPVAACNAVLRSLLKGGYVEECSAPFECFGFGWRQQDGAWSALRVTDAGLLAIGAAPLGSAQAAVEVSMADAPPETPPAVHSAPPTASAGPEGLQAQDAADFASEAVAAAPAPDHPGQPPQCRPADPERLGRRGRGAARLVGGHQRSARASGRFGAIIIATTEIARELKREPGLVSNADKLQAAPLR